MKTPRTTMEHVRNCLMLWGVAFAALACGSPDDGEQVLPEPVWVGTEADADTDTDTDTDTDSDTDADADADTGAEQVPGVEPIWGRPHGVVTEAFELELHNPFGDGEVRYTLDGSPPVSGTTYDGPLEISSTTVMRAAVVDPEDDRIMMDGGAQTWLFLDQVGSQQAPEGWPEQWWSSHELGPYTADYEMDPDVVGAVISNEALVTSLQALPIVALTMEPEDLFDEETGIHENATEQGSDWEVPGWWEFFDTDGVTEHTFYTGYRVHGGAGRRPDRSPKKSFRLACRGIYDGDLEFPVFPGEEVEDFDTLVLRAGYNRTWGHYQATQREKSVYARERFGTDLYRQMGHLSVHVRHAHLFLNGMYWGIYQMEERPDAHFMASWLGGDADDYDVLNSGVLSDGEDTAWLELVGLSTADLGDEANYARVSELLELEAFADYMLLNFYLGNKDWPEKNYWVGRNRAEDGPFQFFMWDAELIQSVTTDDIVDTVDGVPGPLFQSLRAHEEFRVLVGDRVQAHFFNGGTLTQDNVSSSWFEVTDSIEPAMWAESARWGDHWRDLRDDGDTLYLYDPHWLEEEDWVGDYWVRKRRDIFLEQLSSRDLFPTLEAAELLPFGGEVVAGEEIAVEVASGTAWCTTDGSDPRQVGGAVSESASECGSAFTLSTDATLTVRVLDGESWSPKVAATYTLAEE